MRLALGLTCALLIAACNSTSAITSRSLEDNLVAEWGGPVYYLPYTVLEIEGGPCLAAKPGSSKPEEPKAGASTIVTVDARPTASATSSATTPSADSSKAGADDTKDKGKDKGGADDGKCKPESPDAEYGIIVRSLTLPDPSKGFQSSLTNAHFSADQPKVTISKSGLLSSASATTKDETREAVVAFGKATGSLVGLSEFGLKSIGRDFKFLVPTDLWTDPKNVAAPKPKVKVLCPLDALNKTDCILVSSTQPGLGVQISLESSGHEPICPETATNAGKCRKEPPDCDGEDGLCFRARMDQLVTISIIKVDASLPFATTTAIVPVIDPNRSYSVKVARKPMTQSVTTLAFEDGVLTSLDGNYPSTGGAILSLPADFIGGVAGGISSVLTVRVQNTQSEVDLLKAQAELVAAQQALEQARAEAAGD